MDPRRIVIGTSRANVHEASEAPLVGLLPWTTPEAGTCSIIIKARVALGAPDKILRPATFFARPTQAEPLLRPVDFVPIKAAIDIVLTGHVVLPHSAGAPPGEPIRMSGTLSAGGITTPLELEAEQPGRIPLTLRHARIQGEVGIEGALGPVNLHDGASQEFHYDEEFPFQAYQCASRPKLWRTKLEESSRIVLELLVKGTPHTILDLQLPPVSPRVIVDPSMIGRDTVKLETHLDTVLVDADNAELELTWRAYFPVDGGVRDIERVLIGWASDVEMENGTGWRSILRELPHGHFQHAWFFKDADAGVPPAPLSPQDEKIARYQTWSYPLGPEPQLGLDEFAEVSVELDDEREPRAAVLERHGLDEASFALEERAWLERATAETRRHAGGSPTSDQLVAARERASERLVPRQLTSGKEEP